MKRTIALIVIALAFAGLAAYMKAPSWMLEIGGGITLCAVILTIIAAILKNRGEHNV